VKTFKIIDAHTTGNKEGHKEKYNRYLSINVISHIWFHLEGIVKWKGSSSRYSPVPKSHMPTPGLKKFHTISSAWV
jgi:hypothetical protein